MPCLGLDDADIEEAAAAAQQAAAGLEAKAGSKDEEAQVAKQIYSYCTVLHCTHAVPILCCTAPHCTALYSYCTHTALTLHSHFTHTALILHRWLSRWQPCSQRAAQLRPRVASEEKCGRVQRGEEECRAKRKECTTWQGRRAQPVIVQLWSARPSWADCVWVQIIVPELWT
jgi:hypothetical protein